MPSPQSRARSYSRPKLSETPHTDNVVRIIELIVNASVHTPTKSDAKVLAERFCELLNMFTMDEIKLIKKKDNKFFTLCIKLLHEIGSSGTEEAKVFMDVCKSKLKAYTLFKYDGPPIIRNVQEGGARFKIPAGLVSLLCLVLAIFSMTDLLMNPRNAITLTSLCHLVSKLTWGKLGWVNDFFTGPSATNLLVPVDLVSGPAVISVTGEEGAEGEAYTQAKKFADQLEADANSMTAATEAAIMSLAIQSRGAVTCATRQSCPDAATALLGNVLTPFVAVEDTRPTLLSAISSNQTALAVVRSRLVEENGKWRIIGGRNETLLEELQANATRLENAIAAFDATSSMLSRVPGLDNPEAIATLLRSASTAAFAQLDVPKGELPTRVIKFSPREEKLLFKNSKASTRKAKPVGEIQLLTKESRKVTTAELTAAGIEGVVIDLSRLAETHSELDLAYVEELGKLPELIREAVSLVPPGGTSVNVKDVGALVLKRFKADPKADAFKPPYAVFSAIALKSATEVATHNLGIAQKQVASSLARVFDSNFQMQRERDAQKLTDQLVTQGLTRPEAISAAIEAIELTGRFGMKPKLDNLEYARTVFNCFKGHTCRKEKMEDLYETARLDREVRGWGFFKRLDYVKYNLIFVLFAMLGTSVTLEILLDAIPGIVNAGLSSAESIAGIPKRLLGNQRLAAAKDKLALEQLQKNALLLNEIRGPIKNEMLRLRNAAIEGNDVTRVEERIRGLRGLSAAIEGVPLLLKNNNTRRNRAAGSGLTPSPEALAGPPPGQARGLVLGPRPPPGPPPQGRPPPRVMSTKNAQNSLKLLAEKYKAGFPGGGGGAREGTLTEAQVNELLQQAKALGITINGYKNTNDKTQLNTQIRIVDAIIAHFKPGDI